MHGAGKVKNIAQKVSVFGVTLILRLSSVFSRNVGKCGPE